MAESQAPLLDRHQRRETAGAGSPQDVTMRVPTPKTSRPITLSTPPRRSGAPPR
ncbi:MAG: hypothetical protein R2838_16490 [Caldilineaceae bacterium]